MNDLNLTDQIKREADHCVKCGLCLPHCPTYVKTRDEGDSPRGRIALMQGLAHKQLQLSERLEFHLDRCLTCRACEDVCPSNVHYGRLIDATRTLIRQQRPLTMRRRTLHAVLLDPLITKKPLLGFLARVLGIYQRSGLRWLTRKTGLLKPLGLERLENTLPDIPARHAWQDFYPAHGSEKGRVALFTGCIGSILDREAIAASIRLLRQCGYGVHVPAEQTCCGALHLHSGMADKAYQMAQDNVAVFNGLDIAAILFTSSGCGATLSEYPVLNALCAPTTPSGKFNVPVMDICQFLNNIPWPGHLTFKPLDLPAVVHDPCSLQHVLHQETGPYTLLRKIPGLTPAPLADNSRCCGAAGSYMLSQPGMADMLRDDKTRLLERIKPAYLVTSNIGCALHLMAGIRDEDLDTEVLHAVTLLERQMT